MVVKLRFAILSRTLEERTSMRMSFSRLAAVGAVLAAGVTLASCVSSANPMGASGPNPDAIGFPGGSARVHFIQGSPQLNLGVNNLDVYIDNKLAFTNFEYPFACFPAGINCPGSNGPVVLSPAPTGPVVVGPVSPYIELPIGTHDFRFLQHGTGAPVFLEAQFTLKANTKYAIIPEGDAGFHTTAVGIFVEPVYNTSNGAVAASTFNASPKAGTIGMYYNCPLPGASCQSSIGSAVTVGNATAPTSSWKTNVLLLPSTGGQYCFGAYIGAVLIPGGALFGNPLPAGTDPKNFQCPAGSTVIAGNGLNVNFYVIDLPSLPPIVPPGGPSTFLSLGDTNG